MVGRGGNTVASPLPNPHPTHTHTHFDEIAFHLTKIISKLGTHV